MAVQIAIPWFTLTLMKLPRHKTGFTLVELLVVISIISIISAVGITTFSNVQVNNRDQKRFRDVQTVKQALEIYRNDNHNYPYSLNSLLTKYLEELPSDSKPGRQYGYMAYKGEYQSCSDQAKDCTGFVLCASLEGSGSFTKPAGCENVSCGEVCGMGVMNP